ncbi:MAG: hypothetical protein JWP92_849 [Caulobacter sp.]|nr:hypothetical protein [Caulobacter sp.]
MGWASVAGKGTVTIKQALSGLGIDTLDDARYAGSERRVTAAGADCRQTEIGPMARAPSYSFERQERDRIKAAKVAEKAEAKRIQRARDKAAAEGQADPSTSSDDQ